VLWASLYEKPDEPDYLCVAMKISNIEGKIGTVYAVHRHYDGIHYDIAFRNGVLIPYMDFALELHHYEGRTNVETGTITWKVLKSCVGNPQPGDVITQSYVFTAQRISNDNFRKSFLHILQRIKYGEQSTK